MIPLNSSCNTFFPSASARNPAVNFFRALVPINDLAAYVADQNGVARLVQQRALFANDLLGLLQARVLLGIVQRAADGGDEPAGRCLRT